MRRFLLAAVLLLLVSPPLVAEPCGWLAAKEVDAALPAFAPWSGKASDVAGSCMFTGAGGNIFGPNQMVKASPEEAASYVRGMRPQMERLYVVAPAKDIGAEGFTYRPKDGAIGERSLFFVGHEGRVVVLASLILQVPVSAEHAAGATKLVRAALAVDKKTAAIAALTDCPWLVTSISRQLLPGESFSRQRFGNDSCLA